MISGSNEQLQQELEYTLLKPDCHSWGISKMQSGREDTKEERYTINTTETYGMLQTAFGASCMNRASVFEWHKRFKFKTEFLLHIVLLKSPHVQIVFLKFNSCEIRL